MENMSPRFSVILPLYNKEPYIAKALGSVCDQTCTDWELVVVNDGSLDDSLELAKSKIGTYPKNIQNKIHIIDQENSGVAVARNNGVVASQGDYLCFLDADDWWEPKFLDEVDKLIAEIPHAGIYGTNYTIVNETKRKTRVANVGVDDGFIKGYINYFQVYTKTLTMPITSSSVCIPRGVFDEMQGFPKGIKLGEDFLLWIHIALKYKVVFLNKPLAYYNQDVEQNSRAVGHIYAPEYHMLWNLQDLEQYEQQNADYKILIDKLRVNGLMCYFISNKYHNAALKELEKVDWENQPKKIRKQYKQPIAWLKARYTVMKIGAMVKQILISLLFSKL